MGSLFSRSYLVFVLVSTMSAGLVAQDKQIIIRKEVSNSAENTEIGPEEHSHSQDDAQIGSPTASQTESTSPQKDYRKFEHIDLPPRRIPPQQAYIDKSCQYYDAINDWRCDRTALNAFFFDEQIEIEFKGIEAPSVEIKRHPDDSGQDCIVGLKIQFKATDRMMINWLNASLMENGIAKGIRPDFLPEAFEASQARPTVVEKDGIAQATLIPNHETCLAPLTLDPTVQSHETRVTLPFTIGNQTAFIRWTRSLKTDAAHELEALRMRTPPSKPADFYPWRIVTGLGLIVASGAMIGVPALIDGIQSEDTGFVIGGSLLGLSGLGLVGYGVYKEVPQYKIFREKMDRYETYQKKILLQE